jgi:TetR/AcrR family transcriptional regulator, acrAB operon repressor
MQQEQRSQRSRTQILEAALDLFSSQGYRGTSVREIAERAKLSTGNVYHHFPDKEKIFRTLLDDYWAAIESAEFPFNRALAGGAFPDDLEALGRAARESVESYRRHILLIYVDVVEFEGSHIRKFYSEMAQRFDAFVAHHYGDGSLADKLRPGIPAGEAAMLVARLFLNYFAVEILFGVHDHYGKRSDQVIEEIAGILRHGMLR